jgi:DUF3047 family protein
MGRTRYRVTFLLLTLLILLYPASSLRAEEPATRMVEDFENLKVGGFPAGFITYPSQRTLAPKVYSVSAEPGNNFLRAVAKDDISVQIFKPFDWKIDRSPHFSWRWRAKTLPQGASEEDQATNDSSCGIYVVFGRWKTKTLKYVWSTTLSVGTLIEKDPGKFYTIVMESGSKNVGSWRTFETNVLEDYRRAYHSNPEKQPAGFGILTDGNAMHSLSACDYDDFRISE